MALEIERRFLVRGDGWRSQVRWQRRLQQGYLVSGPASDLTLRVRSSDTQAWLTLKAQPPGSAALPQGTPPPAALSRLEFEYPIPLADAEALLQLAPQRLQKWRYGLDLPGGDWVLDVFEGANAPLVIAEVELARPDQPVTIPPWCWREISLRPELSNAALAARPLQQWSETEREALLGPGEEGTEDTYQASTPHAKEGNLNEPGN